MRIEEIVPVHIRHLRARGRADRTVKGAGYDLRPFLKFLDDEGVHAVEDLTASVMNAYQEELAFRLTAKGTLLTLRTRAQLLGVARRFTRFLKDRDYLLHDPGAGIKPPRKPKTLPRAILTQTEVKRLMAAPDMRTDRGYRNRVILEILYDTAVRREETTHIRLTDLDLGAGYLRVTGKGAKDRVVPVSARVCDLIGSYIAAVRPVFLGDGEDDGHLILNRWGRRMGGSSVYAAVKRCARLSGLRKNVTVHALRHACATHMLGNGAPVRHIQEMLGHESLESTQIYTHVTINDLKRIHAKYHPGERMGDR